MISFRNYVLAIMICSGLIYSNKLLANNQVEQSIRPKPWKITEQQFLDQYGKDDSSCALIRYYFERRKRIRKSTSNLAIITGGFAILSGGLIAGSQNSRSDNIGVLFVVLLGTTLSVLITVIFGVALISMTKKYLFKLLKKHRSGKRIPGKISETPLFQNLLQEVKDHS